MDIESDAMTGPVLNAGFIGDGSTRARVAVSDEDIFCGFVNGISRVAGSQGSSRGMSGFDNRGMHGFHGIRGLSVDNGACAITPIAG